VQSAFILVQENSKLWPTSELPQASVRWITNSYFSSSSLGRNHLWWIESHEPMYKSTSLIRCILNSVSSSRKTVPLEFGQGFIWLSSRAKDYQMRKVWSMRLVFKAFCSNRLHGSSSSGGYLFLLYLIDQVWLYHQNFPFLRLSFSKNWYSFRRTLKY
jgi:hypothetical protein